MELLIVEDDTEFLDLMVALFSRKGFICTSVDNFDDAKKEILATKSFDFFLIDIVLRDKSGLELIPLIQSIHTNKNAKIIVASGSISKKIEASYQVWKFCHKPFDLFALIQEMQRIAES